MKFLATVVVAMSVLALTWGDDYNEILEKKAPWLIVPQPKVVDDEQFPWQVAMIADDSFFCAGSLVSRKWVLTAAHCTADYQIFDLAIGSNQDVRQTTREVVRYPDYKPESQQGNLALLELPNEAPLTPTVGLVRLPPSSLSTDNLDGMNLTLAGWPSLQDKLQIWAGVSSPPLKCIQVRGAPESACQVTYGQSFSSNQICLDTGSSPHVEGVLSLADGGSPILYLDKDEKYTQVGILSSGPGHSTLRPPVIATKLVSVLSWIQEVTGMPPKEQE